MLDPFSWISPSWFSLEEEGNNTTTGCCEKGNVINAFEALKYRSDERCRKALEEINNSVSRARLEYCGVKDSTTR